MFNEVAGIARIVTIGIIRCVIGVLCLVVGLYASSFWAQPVGYFSGLQPGTAFAVTTIAVVTFEALVWRMILRHY